jgi:16S rRNA (adenine1518-N6/adenine1519-N6)-dimethyltransferase
LKAGEVRAFLENHGLAARRERGQNFLHDERVAAKLARIAEVGPGDRVIEIGTGLGILTRALAARAGRVITIEVDAGIVRALRREALLPEGVELIHGDALEIDLDRLMRDAPGPVRVVGNLPYAAASPILRRLLDCHERLESWSVTVQKEVAARLLAAPGSREYGSLSALHQLVARVRNALDLHPRCFYPVPRVTSTFLHLSPRMEVSLAPGELRRVEAVVRAAFAHRRKTIVNSLRAAAKEDGNGEGSPVAPEAAAEVLARCGIEGRARAQDLSPEQWLGVARELAGAAGATEGGLRRDPPDPSRQGRKR